MSSSSLNPCYYNNPRGASWASAHGINTGSSCCARGSSASSGWVSTVNYTSFPCTTCVDNAFAGCVDNWGDCDETVDGEPTFIGHHQATYGIQAHCDVLVRGFDSSASKWVYGSSDETPFWYYNHRGNYASEEEWSSSDTTGEFFSTFDNQCLCYNGMAYEFAGYISDGETDYGNWNFVNNIFDHMWLVDGCEGCCACQGWSRIDYPNYPYMPWAAHTCCTGSLKPLQTSSSSSPSYKYGPPKPSWPFPKPWPTPPIPPTSSSAGGCPTGPCGIPACSSVRCCGHDGAECQPRPTAHIGHISFLYSNFRFGIYPAYDYRQDPVNPSLTSFTTAPWYVTANEVTKPHGIHNPNLPKPIWTWSSKASVSSSEHPWFQTCVSNCYDLARHASSSSAYLPTLKVGKHHYCNRPWWTHANIRHRPYWGDYTYNFSTGARTPIPGASLSPYSPGGFKFKDLSYWRIFNYNWYHYFYNLPQYWSHHYYWCQSYPHKYLKNDCHHWWLRYHNFPYMGQTFYGGDYVHVPVLDIHFAADKGWKGWLSISDYCAIGSNPYSTQLNYRPFYDRETMWTMGDVDPELYSSGLTMIPHGMPLSSPTVYAYPSYATNPRIVHDPSHNANHFWVEIPPGLPSHSVLEGRFQNNRATECWAGETSKYCGTLGRMTIRFFPDVMFAGAFSLTSSSATSLLFSSSSNSPTPSLVPPPPLIPAACTVYVINNDICPSATATLDFSTVTTYQDCCGCAKVELNNKYSYCSSVCLSYPSDNPTPKASLLLIPGKYCYEQEFEVIRVCPPPPTPCCAPLSSWNLGTLYSILDAVTAPSPSAALLSSASKSSVSKSSASLSSAPSASSTSPTTQFIYTVNTTGGTGGLATHAISNAGILSLVDSDDTAGSGFGVWSDGEFIYYAGHGSGLSTFSVDDQGDLTKIDTHYTGNSQTDFAIGVWGDGDFIYLANGAGCLHVYSVTSLGILQHLGSANWNVPYNSGGAMAVWGDGDFIYVACSKEGLRVYEVDNAGTLSFVGSDDQGGDASDVWGDGNFIYLANDTLGLQVYTVSNSGILQFVGSHSPSGDFAIGVWGDGNFVYLAEYYNGIHSYLVDSNGNLQHIDSDDQGGIAFKVSGDGNFVYLANADQGLLSYTVSNTGFFTFKSGPDPFDGYCKDIWCGVINFKSGGNP